MLDQEVDGSAEIAVKGLFIEIGADPRTHLAVQFGIKLNGRDEIIVDRSMGTNVHGVFAAGDTFAQGDSPATAQGAKNGQP